MQRSGIAYYLMYCTAEVALKESATLEEEHIEVEGNDAFISYIEKIISKKINHGTKLPE